MTGDIMMITARPSAQMIATVQPLIPALRRYARGLLRDSVEADDLVQDALERIITRWSQRRDDGSLQTWAFRILHNLAMDRMRRQRRRGAPVDIDELPEQWLTARATQEDEIARQDILRSLAALPDEQRSVILFVAVEGLSYAEVAEVMGIPVGTVMSRLSRGREKIRELSARYENGGDEQKLRVVRP